MKISPIIHAFKHIHVPLMIVGEKGEILHCNQAAEALFGYESRALIDRPVVDILPVSSVEELNAFIDAPAVDVVIKRMVGRKKDGEKIAFSVHMSAVEHPTDGLQHALVLRDLTEELEAARLAKAELKRAHNAIKGSRVGVFEYNPVTEEVHVSRIWRELLELDPSDPVDVVEEWRSRVHPDDLEKAIRPILTCSQDQNGSMTSEHRLRSKDGTHWRWMHTDVAVAHSDVDGRVVSIIGAMKDVSDRKKIENDLRVSVAQFKSAFDNATVGMATIDLDGSFRSINSALCKLLGYSEKELRRTNFQSLTHPDDLQLDVANLTRLSLGKESSYQVEKRYIRADSTIIWVFVSVGVVKDADGRPEHYITQVLDITERRRLRRLKNEFVATVSHELRTPLTSVLGSLALLSAMDQEPFSDDAQRLLFIAQENGKRLQALVNDILDFEKFSVQQMKFEVSKANIIELVENTAAACQPLAEKYGVEYAVNCADRTATGYVDPDRFQQVMINLLTNAAKFADAGSVIDVAIAAQGCNLKVSVTNDGIGIPKDFREHIFKPFSQAEASDTRARGGTGLGLNISKQIVEQTGGTIGFDSEELGKTTFWFTVPTRKKG